MGGGPAAGDRRKNAEPRFLKICLFVRAFFWAVILSPARITTGITSTTALRRFVGTAPDIFGLASSGLGADLRPKSTNLSRILFGLAGIQMLGSAFLWRSFCRQKPPCILKARTRTPTPQFYPDSSGHGLVLRAPKSAIDYTWVFYTWFWGRPAIDDFGGLGGPGGPKKHSKG